jgi:hypothetical protein
MKTIALILLIVPLWVSSGLAQDNNITGLLNKEGTRMEIYNAILNDHNLMSKFIDAIKHNDHAMMMMNENFHNPANSNGMGNGSMMDRSSMMGNEHLNESRTGSSHHMNGMTNGNEMMNQMIGIMKENPQMMPQIMGRMMDISESDSTLYKNMVEVMREHQHVRNMGMQKMMNHDRSKDSRVQHMPHN